MKAIEIHKIQVEKGKPFTIDYINDFEKRWYEVVGRLKRSKVDLAKINLVSALK